MLSPRLRQAVIIQHQQAGLRGGLPEDVSLVSTIKEEIDFWAENDTKRISPGGTSRWEGGTFEKPEGEL